MKPIKFDLPINGIKVRNLEELRDNFTTEILDLHASGLLLKWLRCRNLAAEAEKLSAIPDGISDAGRLASICTVFGVEADRQVIESALSPAPPARGEVLRKSPAVENAAEPELPVPYPDSAARHHLDLVLDQIPSIYQHTPDVMKLRQAVSVADQSPVYTYFAKHYLPTFEKKLTHDITHQNDLIRLLAKYSGILVRELDFDVTQNDPWFRAFF